MVWPWLKTMTAKSRGRAVKSHPLSKPTLTMPVTQDQFPAIAEPRRRRKSREPERMSLSVQQTRISLQDTMTKKLQVRIVLVLEHLSLSAAHAQVTSLVPKASPLRRKLKASTRLRRDSSRMLLLPTHMVLGSEDSKEQRPLNLPSTQYKILFLWVKTCTRIFSSTRMQ